MNTKSRIAPSLDQGGREIQFLFCLAIWFGISTAELKSQAQNLEKSKPIQSQIKNETSDDRGGYARVPQNPLLEKLTVIGRLQLRGVSGETDSPFNNGRRDFNAFDVNVRRARLGWVYEGDKWWGAAMSLRVEDMINRPYLTRQSDVLRDSSGNEVTVVRDVQIRDSFGGLQEAYFWIRFPWARTQITFGQFPIPFLREFQMTSANLILPERSAASAAYPQMDFGGMIGFNPLLLLSPKWENYLQFQAGSFNGKGSGLEGTGRVQVLTNTRSNTQPLLVSPLLVWRLQFNPFGGLSREGKSVGWTEGEEIFQRELKWSIGIASMQTKELATSGSFNPQVRGIDPFPILLVQTTPSNGFGVGGTGANSNGIVDTSQTSNPNQYNLTNANRPSFGLVAHTYDSTFTWKGWYFNTAYTNFSGAASKEAKMSQGTFGYNIEIDEYHIMPVIRVDELNADFNLNGKKDPEERIRSTWVGLNFFVDGHLFKGQLYYQIIKDKLGYEPIVQSEYDARNNLLIFQVQATFWTGLKNFQALDSVR